MKTIAELKKHHNTLAEQTLMYLIRNKGEARRSDLDDYLSEVMKELIGEDEYRKQELNCIGVAHETVKSLLKDKLVEEDKAMIGITRKGRFVDSMIYSVYSRMKAFALLGGAIDLCAKIFGSVVWLACFMLMAASLAVGLLLGV